MFRLSLAAAAFLVVVPFGAGRASAHCDTLEGPVVKDGMGALESGDITPVLKWVAPEKEGELRQAFAQSRGVRSLGPPARALADRAFLETLVRVHREGEGAAYTGLKPTDPDLHATAIAADEALEKGAAAELVDRVTADVARGLRERFARVVEARRHAHESVQRGREYVAAYVDFVHYAERVHAGAASAPQDGGHTAHDAPPHH